MFGGHQAEIGHQLPRIGEASKCTLGLDRQLVVIGANLALSVPAELGVAAVPAALELIKDGVAKMAWSITCCIAPGSMPRAGLGRSSFRACGLMPGPIEGEQTRRRAALHNFPKRGLVLLTRLLAVGPADPPIHAPAAADRAVLTVWRRQGNEVRFAADSPPEEAGFEPSVPRDTPKFSTPAHVTCLTPCTRKSRREREPILRGCRPPPAEPMVRIPCAPAGSPLQTPLARAEFASASAGSSASTRRGVPSARG